MVHAQRLQVYAKPERVERSRWKYSAVHGKVCWHRAQVLLPIGLGMLSSSQGSVFRDGNAVTCASIPSV